MRKIRQGGNQATREPPLRAAAICTGKILRGRDTYQVTLPAHPHMTAGREEREQESAKIR